MIKVGIIGGAGYTAGELLRILVNHPEVEISFVHSTSNAGNPVASVHTTLFGECDLCFSEEYDLTAIDALFICSAHGQSGKFLAENEIPEGLRIIDLAQDFRDESNGFVYGLPELNRERTRGAERVANPGCFATAIQLALLPLAAKGLLTDEVFGEALRQLKSILSVVPSEKLRIDFSVINDMNYYNGIVLKGFISGIPQSILSGGQYDLMMQRAGRSSGAMGFAIYLDLLEDLTSQRVEFDIDTVLLYDKDTDLSVLSKTVRELTEKGLSVTAQKAVPEKLKYRQLLKLNESEVEILEAHA